MSGLPEGWATTELGSIISLSKEKADPSTSTYTTYIGLEHIESNSRRLKAFGSASEVKSTKNLFRKDSVLYGKLRPYLNKVWVSDREGICSTDILVLDPAIGISSGFVERRISSPDFIEHAMANSSGMNLPRTKYSSVSQFEINLPPANEQKRIVKKLTTCEARIEAAREALSEVPQLLEDYRQSVLAAAFRGDLTAKWRAQHADAEPAEQLLERLRHERRQRWEQTELEKYEAKGKAPPKDWKKKYKAPDPLTKAQIDELPELPEGWCWAKCEEVTSALRYGSSAKSKKAGEIPVLRMGNLQDGEIDWDSLVYTSDPDEIGKYKLPEQAVLFNRTNSPDLVGKTSIYRGNPQAIFAGYLIHVETLESYLPEFINLVLNSPRAKDWCQEVKSDGVSQSNISASKLAEFPVPICPVSEQSELVTATYRALNLRKSLQSYNNQTTADLTSLTQSLLAKAFNGELVPQDPNDEPAIQLLERIAEERQQKAKKVSSK